MSEDYVLEELMNNLGELSCYQGFQFLLHVLSGVTAGIQMLMLVTISAVPSHRCYIDHLDNSSQSFTPWNTSELSGVIPLNAHGELDECHMYGEDKNIVPCKQFVFDRTYYEDTRAIDWLHVCERRWLGALLQSSFMFGELSGALILGRLADRMGRKHVFCCAALLQLLIGVTEAFVEDYAVFLITRFLLGVVTLAGTFLTGFVLTMELVGNTKRTSLGIAFQAVFATGVMLVAGWCAIIKNRQKLQLIYALHSILLLPHWWLMDESPRWLWLQGRAAEAIEIVAKGMRMNRSNAVIDRDYYLKRAQMQSSLQQQHGKNVGLGAVFRAANMRKKTLNMCLCWFANSLVYFGLSLNTGQLPGHKLLIIFMMSFIELPSYATVAYAIDVVGRRPITSIFLASGGFFCIAAAFTYGTTIATYLSILGKLFVAGSFSAIYNYSAELFPTVVRNSAMSLCTTCSSLAACFTPFITLLDGFDPVIPAIVFGGIALTSGFWVTCLPETMHQPIPESMLDGERYGVGDTCFSQCTGRKECRKPSIFDEYAENNVSLNTVERD